MGTFEGAQWAVVWGLGLVWGHLNLFVVWVCGGGRPRCGLCRLVSAGCSVSLLRAKKKVKEVLKKIRALANEAPMDK